MQSIIFYQFHKQGAFRCSCRSGYRPSSEDLTKCVDIDECATVEKGHCSHRCMVIIPAVSI